jgi:cytochrome d ubiquinol oxidase subunit II
MQEGYLNLETLWFALIGVLWTGFFFLEGFDFGVGTLLPFLGKDEIDRRVIVNTIGPVWDGNEVWLLVAGGATFAAFPEWYATLFSGFYLALFLVLAALIFRGVAFEFRGKESRPRWRARWDLAIFWGSAIPALQFGVAWANILRGTPIGEGLEWQGSFFDLLHPYALLGGLTSLLLFTLHGGAYLTLKTKDDLQARARSTARLLAIPTTVVVFAFLAWTYLNARDLGEFGLVPPFVPILALVAVAAVEWVLREKLDGWAFALTALAIVGITATFFLNLYPRVMVSSLGARYDLTIWNASSTHYTLKVMTIVAAIFTPLVLTYQAWTYWVFRKRIGREDVASQAPAGSVAEH